jgi:hypothetical protein
MPLPQTAYVETYTETAIAGDGSGVVVNIVYAQRYSADNTKIGPPIQITDNFSNSTPISTLMLSNGNFIVAYENAMPDSPDQPYFFGIQEFNAGGQNLNTSDTSDPGGFEEHFDAVALSGGAYAYILETVGDEAAAFIDAKTLVFVAENGVATTLKSPLAATEFIPAEDPYFTELGPTTLVHNSDDTFTVSGADTDYGPNGVDGTRTYFYAYSDNGQLLRASVYDSTDDYRETAGPVTGEPYTFQDVTSLNGVVETLTRDFADGSLELSYVLNSNGTTTTTTYDAPEGAYETMTDAANGTLLQANFYNANKLPTESITVNPDGSRVVQSPGETVTYMTNGSYQDFLYNLPGKPYATQTSFYDATGKLLRVERNYASSSSSLTGPVEFQDVINSNGSSSVVNYDTSGRLTTSLGITASGVTEATIRTYTGTSTTPTTIEEDIFDATGKEQSSNLTNADGSHDQRAFVAGVTLTSTPNVADAFTSSTAGSDRFVFQPSFGQDVIDMFHAGSGASHDTIEFESSIVATYADLQPFIKASSAGTLITFASNESLLIKGVEPDALTSSDFSFPKA